MSDLDRLRARLAELDEERDDVLTAIRVLERLNGAQQPAPKPAPILTVRKVTTATAKPAGKRYKERPAMDFEGAERARDALLATLRQHPEGMASGHLLAVTLGKGPHDKKTMDRHYNAIAALRKKGLLVTEEFVHRAVPQPNGAAGPQQHHEAAPE